MASTKKTITQVKVNNMPNPVTIPSTAVETEVVDGQIVPRRDIVDRGVVTPTDK